MKVKMDKVDDIKSFVRIATNTSLDVILTSGRWVVDGKSLLGILSLDLSKPITCQIGDKDSDASEVSKVIAQIKSLGVIVED